LLCYGRAKKDPEDYLDAVGGLRASFSLVGDPSVNTSAGAVAVGFTGIVPGINAMVGRWLRPLQPVLQQVRDCAQGQTKPLSLALQESTNFPPAIFHPLLLLPPAACASKTGEPPQPPAAHVNRSR
jgi:hypothetical protein